MVIVSPQDLGLWDPFQMAELYGLSMGVTNHLLTGMILQVNPPHPVGPSHLKV